MRECLRAVAKFESRAEASMLQMTSMSDLTVHAESLYMAIKHLTEDTARKVVLSSPKEDGLT